MCSRIGRGFKLETSMHQYTMVCYHNQHSCKTSWKLEQSKPSFETMNSFLIHMWFRVPNEVPFGNFVLRGVHNQQRDKSLHISIQNKACIHKMVLLAWTHGIRSVQGLKEPWNLSRTSGTQPIGHHLLVSLTMDALFLLVQNNSHSSVERPSPTMRFI